MDFLGYLREKEEMEAALEILPSHELMAQMEEAAKAIKGGKLDEFMPWEKVNTPSSAPSLRGVGPTGRSLCL